MINLDQILAEIYNCIKPLVEQSKLQKKALTDEYEGTLAEIAHAEEKGISVKDQIMLCDKACAAAYRLSEENESLRRLMDLSLFVRMLLEARISVDQTDTTLITRNILSVLGIQLDEKPVETPKAPSLKP